MANYRCIMMTTHLDRHGEKVSVASLKSAAKRINGSRKLRAGYNHDWTFPPAGRIIDALIEKRKDGEYHIVATRQDYDKQDLVRMPDGSPGILEYFQKDPTPFVEAEAIELEQNELRIDYNNFSSHQAVEAYIKEVSEDAQCGFMYGALGRKALINDPEIVLALSKYATYGLLGSLALKASEKLNEKIAEELIKLYELVKHSAIKGIKSMLPKYKKLTYIIRSSGTINIELIIRTSDAKVVVDSITEGKLTQCRELIRDTYTAFNPEKLNLLYNEEKGVWEFNYLITKDGSSLSSPKAYNARQKVIDLSNTGADGEGNDRLKLQYNSVGGHVNYVKGNVKY